MQFCSSTVGRVASCSIRKRNSLSATRLDKNIDHAVVKICLSDNVVVKRGVFFFFLPANGQNEIYWREKNHIIVIKTQKIRKDFF